MQKRKPDEQRFDIKTLQPVHRSVRWLRTLLFLTARYKCQREKQNQNAGGQFYQSAEADCFLANSLILSSVRVASGRNPKKYITR